MKSLKPIISILLILLFLYTFTYASSDNETAKKDIQKLDNIVLRTFFGMPMLSLSIRDKNKNGKEIKYDPNVGTNVGLGISYNGFGISYAIDVPHSNKDEFLCGKSRSVSFMFNYIYHKVGMDTYYQKYKGFYIEDTKSFYPSWNTGDPYFKEEKLNLETIGLNLYYIHSNKFSFNAAFKQTARQNKSAGTFLLMLSQTYLEIKNGGSLIPDNQKKYYGREGEFCGGDFYSLTLAPGYAYTFTKSNFFITPVLFLGGGIQHQRYRLLAEKNNRYTIASKLNMRLSMGYNGNTYYAGFFFVGDFLSFEIKELSMSSQPIYSQLFFGIKI